MTVIVLRSNQLSSLRLPDGLSSLNTLNVVSNPLNTLEVPVGITLERIELFGFDKSNVTFYIPLKVETVGDQARVIGHVGN